MVGVEANTDIAVATSVVTLLKPDWVQQQSLASSTMSGASLVIAPILALVIRRGIGRGRQATRYL
jgi:hypothetical protein